MSTPIDAPITASERELFEKHAVNMYAIGFKEDDAQLLTRDEDGYLDHTIDNAWSAWMVRAAIAHSQLPQQSPADHIADAGEMVLDEYDAGLLNDFGGGNVGWWQDYIRAELGRAHEFYQSQVDHAGDANTIAPERIADARGTIEKAIRMTLERAAKFIVEDSDCTCDMCDTRRDAAKEVRSISVQEIMEALNDK